MGAQAQQVQLQRGPGVCMSPVPPAMSSRSHLSGHFPVHHCEQEYLWTWKVATAQGSWTEASRGVEGTSQTLRLWHQAVRTVACWTPRLQGPEGNPSSGNTEECIFLLYLNLMGGVFCCIKVLLCFGVCSFGLFCFTTWCEVSWGEMTGSHYTVSLELNI